MPVGSTRSINTYCWVYLSSDHPFHFYYKVRQLILSQSAIVCYHKVPQVLLQSATGITKCEKFITKCDRYYNVRQNTAVRNEQYSRKKKNNLRILCLEEHTGENLEEILFRPKL